MDGDGRLKLEAFSTPWGGETVKLDKMPPRIQGVSQGCPTPGCEEVSWLNLKNHTDKIPNFRRYDWKTRVCWIRMLFFVFSGIWRAINTPTKVSQKSGGKCWFKEDCVGTVTLLFGLVSIIVDSKMVGILFPKRLEDDLRGLVFQMDGTTIAPESTSVLWWGMTKIWSQIIWEKNTRKWRFLWGSSPWN